jgi:hypothetical protein
MLARHHHHRRRRRPSLPPHYHLPVAVMYILSHQWSFWALFPQFVYYTPFYIVALPDNASNNLWVLDLATRFIGYSPGRITINYNAPNITYKSGILFTRQFFTGWPLVFFCTPSPNSVLFACFCRAYSSLVNELRVKLSLHSLLIWNWLPHLELPSFGEYYQSRVKQPARRLHRKPSSTVG